MVGLWPQAAIKGIDYVLLVSAVLMSDRLGRPQGKPTCQAEDSSFRSGEGGRGCGHSLQISLVLTPRLPASLG
jgi:hypothetical protein